MPQQQDHHTIVKRLSDLRDPAAVAAFLQQYGRAEGEALLLALAAQSQRLMEEDDPQGAFHLAVTTGQVAEWWADPTYIAAAWVLRGDAARATGDLPLALNLYEEAITQYGKLGDSEEVASGLANCGLVAMQMGNLEQALSYLHEALEGFRLLDEQGSCAKALLALGGVYCSQGNPTMGISCYHEALALSQTVGYAEGETAGLINLADLAREQGRTREALDYLNRALPLCQAHDDYQGEATIHLNLGAIYGDQRDLARAERSYTEALQLAETRTLWQQRIGAMIGLGSLHEYQGRMEAAEAMYHQALQASERAGFALGIATINHNLGILYKGIDVPDKALVYLEQARAAFETMGDVVRGAWTVDSLGALYRDMGRLREAQTYHEEALALFRQVEHPVEVVRTLTNLGLIKKELGEIGRAISYLEAALDHGAPLSQPKLLGDAQLGLGLCWRLLDDGRQEHSFRAARDAYEVAGDGINLAIALSNLGLVELDRGNYPAAVQHLRAALELHHRAQNPWGVAATTVRLAAALALAGATAEAKQGYQAALYLSQQISYLDGEVDARVGLAEVATQLGAYAEAESWLAEAGPLAERLGNPTTSYEFALARGTLYEAQGRWGEAVRAYEQASQTIESVRAKLQQATQRVRYWGVEGTIAVERLTFLLHSTLHQEGAAFYQVERIKSRTFLDLLARAPLSPPPTLSVEQRTQEQALLDYLRGLLAIREREGGENALEIDEAIDQTSGALVHLWESLSTWAPEYIALRRGHPSTWSEVRSWL